MADNPIDWDAVALASRKGELLALLEFGIPRARWSERNKHGATLLHVASLGCNVAAVVKLVQHGVDVDARDSYQSSACHTAASRGQHQVLRVLCAAGADVTSKAGNGFTALDMALKFFGAADCVRVLLAHGVRLSSARKDVQSHVERWMWALESGRARCRAVVVALLALKRRRTVVMRELDRFIVRELAISIFATRTHTAWHKTRLL